MVVYCIKNKINGKMYIGQTVQKNYLDRIRYHFNGVERRGVSLIKKAIIKYGKDNFEVSVLHKANTIDELNLMERELISKHNTVRPYGYNIQLGGDGPGKLNPETIRKMAERNRGRPGVFKGKKFTKEHCANLSKVRKGVDTPRRRAAREAMYEKRRLNGELHGVVAINIKTGESKEYVCITDCAKDLGLCSANISSVIHGKENRTQHKGYTFLSKKKPGLVIPLREENPMKGISKVNNGGFSFTWKGKYIGYRKTLEEILALKAEILSSS